MMSQEELIRELNNNRGVWFTKEDFKNPSVNVQNLQANMRKLVKSGFVSEKFVKIKRSNRVCSLRAIRIV